ncbi:MAG: hypothetical protein A2621_03090 [Alphaproteobacteria bacterium RIFCSPHIGHO2_01_FULL_41_14]|nr:MAG: hypothetical protein A2621_03090 [Alphaproteobacteria bacterium RIFCSPHIGHO2_01_FULL_41_14]
MMRFFLYLILGLSIVFWGQAAGRAACLFPSFSEEAGLLSKRFFPGRHASSSKKAIPSPVWRETQTPFSGLLKTVENKEKQRTTGIGVLINSTTVLTASGAIVGCTAGGQIPARTLFFPGSHPINGVEGTRFVCDHPEKRNTDLSRISSQNQRPNASDFGGMILENSYGSIKRPYFIPILDPSELLFLNKLWLTIHDGDILVDLSAELIRAKGPSIWYQTNRGINSTWISTGAPLWGQIDESSAPLLVGFHRQSESTYCHEGISAMGKNVVSFIRQMLFTFHLKNLQTMPLS